MLGTFKKGESGFKKKRKKVGQKRRKNI